MTYVIYAIIALVLVLTFKPNDICTKKKRRLFVCASILLLSLFALRSTNVGGDTAEYCKFFSGKLSSTYGSIRDTDINVGFVFLCEIFNKISRSSFFFIILSSCISIIPFLIYVKKYSNNPVLSIFFVLASNYSNLIINLETNLRQTIATGYLIGAIYLYTGIEHKQEWRKSKGRLMFVFLLLIASILTHTSMYLTIPIIILLYIIPFSKNLSYILVISALLIACFFTSFFEHNFTNLIMLLMPFEELNSITRYIQENSVYTLTGLSANLLRQLPLACLVLYTIYSTDKNEMSNIAYKCFVTGYCMLTVSISFPLGFRLAFPLQFLGCAFVPLLLTLNKNRLYILLLFYAYFIFRLIMSVSDPNMYNQDNNMLPYEFIFE